MLLSPSQNRFLCVGALPFSWLPVDRAVQVTAVLRLRPTVQPDVHLPIIHQLGRPPPRMDDPLINGTNHRTRHAH